MSSDSVSVGVDGQSHQRSVALSVVASMYRSSPYLEEFCARVVDAATKVVGDSFEIVFVNDGSPDDSLQVALALRQKDMRIKIVDLSRNFGHHKAMMTGLMHASGQRVFLIDCDLEEPPEALAEFWAKLDSDPDLDVVYGVQEKRKGGWFERWSGKVYYCVVNALMSIKIPENIITARLMTRRYVCAVIQCKEQEMAFGGLAVLVGFRQEPCRVNKGCRGQTTYTFRKKICHVFDTIAGFSNTPLYSIFVIGMILSLISFGMAFIYTVQWVISGGTGVTGWTTLVVSIWLVGGMNLFAMGIIGVYMAKIFSETKARPFTVVRQRYMD